MPHHRHPTFTYEQAYWRRGARLLAGLDEVGRGAWAGPVVAAAVVFTQRPTHPALAAVNDSKQLTPAQRERLYDVIRASAFACATGQASHLEIDHFGIVAATRLAMCRALEALALVPDVLLIDALLLPTRMEAQRALIHGDARCFSIAAASIIAKVTRDRMMCEFEGEFPGYHFAEHKGYGTAAHQAALRERGPVPIHRRSFSPIRELVAANLPTPGGSLDLEQS